MPSSAEPARSLWFPNLLPFAGTGLTAAQLLNKIDHKLRRIYNKLFSNLCGKYFCPVCQRKACSFIPMSAFYKENQSKYGYQYTWDDAETLNHKAYSCPHCYAPDRDRLYALYISKRVLKSDAIEMLEIAPSLSLNAMIRGYGRISVRTADLMMEGVDDIIDITNMSCYADGRFDAFICSHVLEHVPDDNKALRELYRVLKPGGWGILMVPVILAAQQIDEDPFLEDVGERWRRFGQYDHIRTYSKSGLLERIANAGFITYQYGKEYFGEEAFARYSISDKSILYVVEKSASGVYSRVA
jgi:SAM-dependent methyltransferase